jgi:transposase
MLPLALGLKEQVKNIFTPFKSVVKKMKIRENINWEIRNMENLINEEGGKVDYISVMHFTSGLKIKYRHTVMFGNSEYPQNG